MECDYENYYYNATAKLCANRTVFCNLQTHYEVPTPLNYTQVSANRCCCMTSENELILTK